MKGNGMNVELLKSLLRYGLVALATYMGKEGSNKAGAVNIEEMVSGLSALLVLLWSIRKNKANATAAAGTVPLLLLGLFLCTGCISRERGTILGVTQTVLGIDISQSVATSSPQIRLGYIRSQYHIVPTAKGEQINAPSVNASMDVNQRLTSNDILEEFQTGAAATAGATNTTPSVAKTGAANKAKK